MFEKIVVPLDGSQLAEQVLPYAREQALHFNSRLVLLRVVKVATDMVNVQKPDEVIDTVPRTPIEEKDALAYLDVMASPLRQDGVDVECATRRESVDVGKDIVNYAQENNMDLIMMATHGHGGLSRMLFGSVAEAIMTHSHLPMLVIRPQE